MRPLSRLVLVLTVVFASLTLAVSPGAIEAQEATPATPTGAPAPFMGETYVGETSDPATFVAVVVAGAAEDGGERQARAYLCNATTVDVWLIGTLAEDGLALRSEDGARLEGTLGDAGVDGTATLADGTALTFAARPATGIAGLYTIAIDAEDQLRGASAAGGELAGQVEAGVGEATGTPVPDFRLVMTVTTPEGETAEVEAAATVAGEGEFRLIVLEDGRLRGKGMCVPYQWCKQGAR